MNATNKPVHQYKAELMLLFCAFNWGLSFPLVKISLPYFSPNAFVFFRFIITVSLFCIIFRKEIRNIKFKELKYGLILGIFLYLGFITQTIGLKFTTASNSAFITGMNLIFLPFVQIFFVKKKPDLFNYIGIVIVIFGMFFLTGMKDLNFNTGDLLTLSSALFFSFQIVLLDKYSQHTGHIPIILGQFLSMLVYSFFSTILLEVVLTDDLNMEFNKLIIFTVIFTSIFTTLLSLFLANKYQKYTTPVRAGMIYNMEQIFAVIFAYLILKEILSLEQTLGAFIMITGILISELSATFKTYFKKWFA